MSVTFGRASGGLRATAKRVSTAALGLFAAAAAMVAPAHAAPLTTVSVTFNNGFVGEYSSTTQSSAQAPQHSILFGTLNIQSVTISQQTDTGLFKKNQGNDVLVDLTVRYTNGTTVTCSSTFVNWLDKSGNFVEGIGLITSNCNDGYTLTTSLNSQPVTFQKTYLLRTATSQRVYLASGVAVDAKYVSGGSSTQVSGSADTNGALNALNAELGAVPPVITGPSGGAGATSSQISIVEGNTAITTLTASKAVNWSIDTTSVTGVDYGAFAINASTGALTFQTAPVYASPTDAGANNSYIVTVKAVDPVNNTLVATQTVTVYVLPAGNSLDGDPPVITGPSLNSETVDENQTGVTQLTADEPVTWSIETDPNAPDDEFFQIAPDGTITFIGAPDYEQPLDDGANNSYIVKIKATDTNNNVSYLTLTVNVRDLTEAGPVITGPSGQPGDANTAITVNEGQTTVFKMSAPGATSWAIVGNNDDAKFDILQDGTIFFLTPPDYELPTDIGANNTYVLTVMVTDANNKVSYQTVTVTVRDLDDIAPLITGPSGGPGAAASAITIFEGQTPVSTFVANEPVTWGIVGGDDLLQFTIDPATGALSFRRAPDYEAPADQGLNNVYVLVLRAVDASGNVATQTVTVTVADIDDTPPAITGPSGGPGAAESTLSINEGLTPVHGFTANEEVTWSITGGADQSGFAIDPATGALTFKAAPDYETPKDADGNNTYIVRIRATDEAGNYSEQTLTVTILNVDEIARKLAEIGGRLRTDLRTYAMRGLGDMLSFNEEMMQSADDDDGNDAACGTNGKKPVSGAVNANEQGQQARLNYTKQLNQCGRPYRVLLNAGLSISGLDGDWTTRTLGSVRVERRVAKGVTLGMGVMASTANDKLRSFADSEISDTSVQLNVYGRARLTETLRAGAFAGLGRAWYDFGLRDTDGFDLTGTMRGRRYAYGAMVSGDLMVGDLKLTTDATLSHAVERLRSAKLSARYLGENRSDIAFAVGTVNSTRLSIPVTGALRLSGSDTAEGTKLLLSPGLLCEDVSVDRSTLSCGYQLGAKVNSRFGEKSKGYLTYRYESVSGLERNLIGLGYALSFGPRNMMEIGFDVDRGISAFAADDSRAMISLRLAR